VSSPRARASSTSPVAERFELGDELAGLPRRAAAEADVTERLPKAQLDLVVPRAEELVREQVHVPLPVVVARTRQRTVACEPEEKKRELAAVHPVLLDLRPHVRAVVLGLAGVRPPLLPVRALVPATDRPRSVEARRKPCAVLVEGTGIAPADSQPKLGLPEEE